MCPYARTYTPSYQVTDRYGRLYSAISAERAHFTYRARFGHFVRPFSVVSDGVRDVMERVRGARSPCRAAGGAFEYKC